jgi:hypothetical protein
VSSGKDEPMTHDRYAHRWLPTGSFHPKKALFPTHGFQKYEPADIFFPFENDRIHLDVSD